MRERERLDWIDFACLLAGFAVVALLLVVGMRAYGSEPRLMVPLTTTEMRAIHATQCPGGSCPPQGSIPYAPRSRQQWGAPRYQPVPPPATAPRQIEQISDQSIPSLPATVHDAVCRITMDSHNAGSGTLVYREGSAGIVATCAHMGGGPCTVAFRDGRTARGELLVDRERQDIGVVHVPQLPDGIQPVAVANTLPERGEWVLACGYGGSTGIELYAAQPNRVLTINTAGREELIEMQGQYRSGDSGGVVFNRSGELVGVINASSKPNAPNQENVATSCLRLRGLLARARERFGFRRGNESAPSKSPVDPPATPQVFQDLSEYVKRSELGEYVKRKEAEAFLSDLKKSQPDWGPQIEAAKTAAIQARTVADAAADSVKAQSKIINSQTETITAQTTAISTHKTFLESKIESIREIASSGSGWTIGRAAASMLGIGGPVGLGIGAAGWLIGRRIKKKLGDEAGVAAVVQPAAAATDVSATTNCGKVRVERVGNNETKTVILESPPLPQVVVERGQQFVPYQAPSPRLDALERAMAEYVRKYPQSAAAFETVNAYAKQFESGAR